MLDILRIDELRFGLGVMGWGVFGSSEKIIQIGVVLEQGRPAGLLPTAGAMECFHPHW